MTEYSTQQPSKLQTLHLQYSCVPATDFDDIYMFNINSITNMLITVCSILIGCFKMSFTTLKAYVLPRIVMVQCDFHW
jgi:hypothetical protein